MADGGLVRWGILGVAKINDRLIPAFRQAANAELRAIASRSADRARAAAAGADIPAAYGSYEALLADPEIDAVYIPLPNALHAEWTVRAAEQGKHILCEKPLASDAAEARRVVEACRRHGVRLMDGFMWPHHPRTARLRRFLDDGGIGEPRVVNGSFTFLLDLDPANIRLQSELAGGSVMDVGCYPVYGARWVFGAEPVRVFAVAQWRNGVDLAMTGLMEFSGGRTATFDCGFTLPMRQSLEIFGTEGRVWVRDMWLPAARASFKVFRDDGPPEDHAVEPADQIVRMIEHFGRAVREERDPSPGPGQAVATMRVLDALRESARTGRPVEVASAD
jgi:predicted dehydrogenase